MKQKIHIPHSLIDKLPHWLIFFFLCSFFSNAQQTQPYEWQWAISGGASLGGTGGGFSDEKIYDIKVGTDGNYYFIAALSGNIQANLDGEEVPVYNFTGTTQSASNDIFLFSTDCEGQIRWSQTIGSWRDDTAYNLVLDSLNNVYVGANVAPNTTVSGPGIRRPLHFTENDSIPFANTANGGGQIPQEAFKTTYLVKYKSNGNLDKKVALQGDVTNVPSEFNSLISDLAIDSQGKIHFIVGLLQGTHLEGQVTVPSSFNDLNNPQYYLAVYNPDLTYHSSMLLDMSGNFFYPSVRFTYDESKNQYYIAGMTSLGVTGSTYPLSFDGDPTENRSFILAIDDSDGSENWRREIYSTTTNPNNLPPNCIFSLAVDNDSNVYVGGSFQQRNGTEIKIYDPTDSSVQPYFFTAGVQPTIPMIIQLNSDGDVQWVQATSAYAGSGNGVAPRYGKGIALKNNEVALGAQGGGDFWGTIEIVRPTTNYQPDPILVRFDKQSGNVIDVHDIEGKAIGSKRMTAVAADNDGNYIAGGSFNVEIFKNNNLVDPLYTTGEADFFVAKLANSACGSGLSTDDFNALSFNVYPNPTTGIINVATTEHFSSYTIYDSTGRMVRENRFDSNNQINLENVNNGIYFIRIVTVEGNAGTVKVVKR